MRITEAYLHVLDANSDVKLLSERHMHIDLEIEDYASKHIEGFFEHLDIATNEIDAIQKMNPLSDDFKETTLNVAELFFDVMKQCEEIKPCDLMCLKFEREGATLIGFLKLNFRTSFAHAVELEDNLIVNKIIRQVTTLPYKTQKVEEGFLVDLTHRQVFIKDKTVTVDGRKTKYISEYVLGVGHTLTPKRKIDLIAKTAQKVIEKYDDKPLIATAKIKQMITSHLDESGGVNMESIVASCFDTEVAKDAYLSELNDKGIDPDSITINETQKKKLKRTQKIKTASGVEIILPFEYVSRSENLEIVNHPDGSVSIQLKNLGELL
ncbi:MAG TPA: hypothetical protein DCS67_04430 [Clostridiales bacterium UBA8960]|nr:hypothetical protein [Clostridiales bacterium UBA8960]